MSASTATGLSAPPGSPPQRRRGRFAIGALLALVVAAVVVVIVADPFSGGSGGGGAGVSDNEYPTSLQSVERESLTSQSQVSGTLGYAGDTTIRLPGGTASAALTQDQQALMSAESMLRSARATLATDATALRQARARLSADEAEESIDCQGNGAGQSPSSGAGDAAAGGSGTCAGDAQLVSGDQQTITQDAAKVSGDQASVASASQSLRSARTTLAGAQAQATFYGASSTFTGLPSGGQIVRRGEPLYEVDGEPVLLLYGSTIATRVFASGMTSGRDVAELNANLDALGYGHGLSGETFTAATAAAIRSLQAAHGMTPTGELLLGSVVFETGAVRVTGVSPTIGVGSSVMPGPVMTVSSTARQITIALDAADQGEVRVGDPVTITLPDDSTTPGRISYVSAVASSGQDGATVAVDAVPTDPAATGSLDQAPVNVAITTGSVQNALVVPVGALLALSSGGYAVEVVSGGVHHLVAVSTGLFDDADGLVAVTGSDLAAGQRVVVPGQ